MTRIKKLFVAIVIVVAAAGLSSCEKYQYNPPAVDPDATWHFQTDIQPIFNSNCALASCHGGPISPALSAGKSFDALSKGKYITAPAETSRLYKKITTDPSHEARLTAAEKLKILYWIQQGAKNN